MQTDRRSFLKSAGAVTGAAAAFPTLLPSSVLGAEAPSKNIALGCIGLGVHGFGVNLNAFPAQGEARITAVRDVVHALRESARARVNKRYKNQDCKVFTDFRRIIEDKSIDAVVISTPDHWHVPMSLMAIEAGKDVFCEKLTKAIAEGGTLVNAVREHGTVFQMGLEDRSVPHYHKMVEWLRNGAIGDLERVEVQLPEGTIWPKAGETPVPEGTDYNLFVGPAPFMPYHPKLVVSKVWRYVSNFGCGSLLDWGSRQFDTAQFAVNAPEVCPVEVEGTGEIPTGMLTDVPVKFDITFRNSTGAEVHVKSGGTGIRLTGSKGCVGNAQWRGRLEARDPKILHTKHTPERSKHWPMPVGGHRNFPDCVKSREQPTCPVEIMHLLHASLHMGDLSIRLNRKLKWDAGKEAFAGDAEADALRVGPQPRNWQRGG